MKKIRLGAVMLLVLSMAMFGCGQKIEETGSEKNLWAEAEAETLASYIVENTKFKDYMDVVDSDIFYGLYNLDETMVKDVTLYSSTGATAEEVAVIKATKGNSGMVEEACIGRVEAQRQGFENYVPEELKKLENPVIIVEEDTVVLVVCDDSDATKELLSNYANKEI